MSFELGSIPIQLIQTTLIIPYFIYKYDSVLYGNWISTVAIISIFLLLDFGYGIPITNEIKNTIGLKKNNIDKLLTSVILLIFVLSLFSATIFLLISNLLFESFNVIYFDRNYIYSLLSLYLFLEIFLGIYGCILNATGHINFVSKIKFSIEFLSLVISIILIYFDYKIYAFIYPLIIKTVINGSIFFYYSKIKNFLFNFNFSFFSMEEVSSFLKKSTNYQIHRINETIYQSADSLIIQYFLGARFVSIYNLTSKLSVLFCRTIAPKISSILYIFLKDISKYTSNKLFIFLNKKLFRLGILFFVFTILINESIVTLFFGKDVYGGNYLNIIFSLWIIVDYLFLASYNFALSSKMYLMLAKSSFYEMLTNLLFSIILIKFYGLIGVAIATLISKSLYSYYFYEKPIINIFHKNFIVFLKDISQLNKIIPFLSISILLIIICMFYVKDNIVIFFLVSLLILIGNLFIYDFKILVNKNISLKEKLTLIINR